jgi:hypothetical protein
MAFTPVAGVVLVRAPKAAAPGIITLRRSVNVCPQSGHIDKLAQSASSGAPATQRFGRFISCGESCFAICRHCFAIADHALGSSRCEAPTARWKRHKVRASGEGEAGILQMTPELARIFASFQPSCKTDAKCGLLEHKKGATWPSPLPSAKAINLVPQRCDTRVAGTLKNGLSGHRSD